jgi:alkylation response protein AidB-like acyl-CoA dehydrogenase
VTVPRDHVVTVKAPLDTVWDAVNDLALWPSLLDGERTVQLLLRSAGSRRFEVTDQFGSWVLEQTLDRERRTTDLARPDGDASGQLTDQLSFREVSGGTEVRWRREEPGPPRLPVPLDRLAAELPTGTHAGAAPLDAARALAPEISALAPHAARARTLPADLVSRMRAAGIYSMGLPRALGGSQSDFHTIVTTVEELSRADGATGWHALIGNTNAFLAWLEPTAAKELIASAGSSSLAGSTALTGRGEAAGPAGFRVSGRWPFCSGSLHAGLLMAGFRVEDGAVPSGPLPNARVGFFRADEAATIHGTWRTMGLEATGSHDLELSGLDIPAEHTAALYFEPARQAGELYRLTPYNILMVLLAGFPLGVARRAIDEATELAHTKTRAGSRAPLIEDAETIAALVEAESTLRAARGLVLGSLDDAWQVLAAGSELSGQHRAGIAMATVHALRSARGIATAMFRLGGAGALQLDHPLQRCLRDVHTAGQHFGFSDDLRLRSGRTFLGLDQPPALYQV